MATLWSELYLLATGALYRLKDGIILLGGRRHCPARRRYHGVSRRQSTAVDGYLAVIYTACHAATAPQALVGVNLRRLTAVDGYLAVIYGLPRRCSTAGVNLRRLTAVDGYLAVIYGLPRRCSTAGVNLRRLTAVDGCLAVIYTACHAGTAPQALVGVNLRRLTAIDGYLAVIYGLPRSYGTASVT
ncbi:hypothetical protein BCR34DRAFT_585649 [Clohesyomyces aquaticus]|uniref:Uncharacterized protein n=1 Tax=Clohesyomyces aquaticus TaxID=1231657 RepID=A0A1Y1ZY26_9PLEO|nr:hypothetical protein BCR34DRAFT_585649 [Clohesyomyces aquaticus]